MNDSTSPSSSPSSLPATRILARRAPDAPFYDDGDAPPDESPFRQIVAMLVRRRKVLLATLATVLLASLVWLMLARSSYLATATLQVYTASPSAGSGDENNLPALADLAGATQSRSLETQLAILKSKAVERGALKRLSPGARVWADKGFSTQIEAVADTDLISISTTAKDSYAAAAISNAFCREYVDLSRRKNRSQLAGATSYVQTQLKNAAARLNRARSALKNYKQRNGTFDVQAESQGLLEEVSQIESEWRQARADKASRLAELQKLRSVAQGIPETRVVPQEIVRRPAIEALKAQLTKLELDRLAALQEYQANRPEVTNIEGQIAAIRARLRSEAQTEVGSWSREVDPVRQTLAQNIAQLQGQVWATEARGVALKASSQRAHAQLARLPEREQQLGQLTTDVSAQQQAYQLLNEKFQTLKMTQDARVANAAILFPADPGTMVAASKGRSLLAALLLGLLLAIGLAALLDWLDDRVHSEHDAKTVSRLPILAQVPYLENAGEQNLLNIAAQSTLSGVPANSPLLETFRMARTMLAFSPTETPARSVVVTSSLPEEGKSMTSLNLAVAAALGGERVILIDCDLRRPSLHRLLDVPNDIGLSNVLTGTHDLVSALQQTVVPNLRALTSGPLVANPFQLLNSNEARECLRLALQEADFVVIDSPPALVLADAQILSTMADATLLVISSRDVGRREISRTRDLLAQTGNRPIGAILNKTASGIGGNYGYYQNAYFENSGGNSLARRFSS